MTMDVLALPVANGILPRPEGSIQGLFLDDFSLRTLSSVGPEGIAFLVPVIQDGQALYPAGMLVQVDDLSRAHAVNPITWNSEDVLVAKLRGIRHAWARRFVAERGFVVAQSLQELNLKELRQRGEPVLSGAGWQPHGGYTEPRSKKDIMVTIYGKDYDGNDVQIRGQMGSLIGPEKAHTLEHSIIRALNQCALCTPKNLAWAMRAETEELKDSISKGLHFKLPEIFGQTKSGYCGNPMTSLAHFYLGQELVHFLKEGRTLPAAIERARSRTLSRLTQDLELGAEPEYLTLRGLKIGMVHDDSQLMQSTLRRVLNTFPIDPWS